MFMYTYHAARPGLKLITILLCRFFIGPALSIKLLIHSVVCIFDYNVKVQACMEAETWQL